MKKSISMKSKPKFAKKRANSKQSETKVKKAVHPATDMPKANPEPTPQPSDVVSTQVSSPTPAVRPCSPAETQKGHHEVVQS